MTCVRDRFLVLATLLVVAATGLAQDEAPVFGDQPSARRAANAEPAPPTEAVRQDVDPLVADLVHWPEHRGVEASRALAARGPAVVPQLLTCLDDNDWRIRAAAAAALGGIRDPKTFDRLRLCVADVANQIAIDTFFTALVAIDPVRATSELVPQLTSNYPRIARSAFEAMPSVIEDDFADRLLTLTRHRDDSVRESAANLLKRLRTPQSPQVWLGFLSDPQARMARIAVDVLADSVDDMTLRGLNDLVLNGASRSASFAALALVQIEDRQNRLVLDETPELVDRATRLATASRQQLDNAAGLCMLAQLSMRSSSATLRKIADSDLVPAMLGLVFGGVVTKDYSAVRDVVLAKVALLTGKQFGNDRDAWIRWWSAAEKGFVARRELSSIDSQQLDDLEIEFAQRRDKQIDQRIWMAGVAAAERAAAKLRRPIRLNRDRVAAVARLLDEIDVFGNRGMKRDDTWSGDFVEVVLRVGAAEFRRVHYDSVPSELRRLESMLVEIESEEFWQLLRDPGRDPDAAAFLAREEAEFAKLDGPARAARTADLAVAVLPQLESRTLAIAARLLAALPQSFFDERLDTLLAHLEEGKLANVQARLAAPIYGRLRGDEATRRFVRWLPLFTEEGRAVALDFLAARSVAEVEILADAADPELRAVLVARHAMSMADARSRELLVHLAEDESGLVRVALSQFVRGRNEATALIGEMSERSREVLGSARRALIENIGIVGGDAAVAVLTAAYAESERLDRNAVVRGLRHAQGADAAAALARIVRSEPDLGARTDAMEALCSLDAAVASAEVRALLAEEKDTERLIEYVEPAARLLKAAAVADLSTFLDASDQRLSGRTALALARGGHAIAAAALIRLLHDRGFGAEAREELEILTSRALTAESSPDALAAEFRQFLAERPTDDSLDWFSSSLREAGFPAIDLLAFRDGQVRDPRALTLLLRVLESDRYELRCRAERLLAGARGVRFELRRESSPQDVERVRQRYRAWVAAIQSDH